MTDEGPPSTGGKVDYVEVDRVAHELDASHGSRAYLYARKIATQALEEGHAESHAFWRAVERSITPR